MTSCLDPSRCAEMIRHSRAVVALTGAGISTAAGIPDFRGARGFYVTRRYDPRKTFDISGFRQEPRFFYEFCRDFVGLAKGIRPTFGHQFLVGLERKGKLSGVITQNIDMLHQMAGSRGVIEIHGSCRSAVCTSCRERYEGLTYQWWERVMVESPMPPIACCPLCEGVLKPDIVFFGEVVKGFDEAKRLVADCDLLLVLGSSLQVAPASHLPLETEAPILVINRGEAMLVEAPHRFFVDADLDGFFRQVSVCLET